jgi:phosphoadenosine phosphosulfate reductase
MNQNLLTEDVAELVKTLNFAQKVDRSLQLIQEAYDQYGDTLVVANSLGKDSSVVWHLAKRVSPNIRGFIVTTRFKPVETKQFMAEEVKRYPELKVFSNNAEIPDKLYETNPDKCCDILKVQPTRKAVQEMNVKCWVTGAPKAGPEQNLKRSKNATSVW